MNGFIVKFNLNDKNLKAQNFQISGNSEFLLDESIQNISIHCKLNNKFFNDKIVYTDDKLILILDGIITNKCEIFKGETKQEWINFVCNSYFKDNEKFYLKFRGSFRGLVYDKRIGQLITFNDHLGTKPLFYSMIDDGIVVTTSMELLYDFLKYNKIPYGFNINSAYMLLSYGFMLDDNTICDDIYKLIPGSYIKSNNDNIKIYQYYELKIGPNYYNNQLGLEECVEMVDAGFRKAVKRQFDKDLEYGYTHLVALSGGLDSRMTSWVANDMGYTKQVNFTFSQSDYYDEKIAKKISSDLKHDWIFKYLDNGLFLLDLDKTTLLSGGNAYYPGLAHGNSMMQYLNFDNFGIIHSGQIGDIVIGTFLKNADDSNKVDKKSGAYSSKLLNKINYVKRDSHIDFTNQELYLIYQRAINGANSGLVIANQYTETMSPFYDIDFFELCLSLPIKYRVNHQLYFNWIKIKYPNAGKYVWEKTKRNLYQNTPKSIKIFSKNVTYEKIIYLLKRKLFKSKTHEINSMNPFDYWYAHNEDIKQFMDNYFKDNISLISSIDRDLNDSLHKLYAQGTTMEKTQVLSLLSTYRLFFT